MAKSWYFAVFKRIPYYVRVGGDWGNVCLHASVMQRSITYIEIVYNLYSNVKEEKDATYTSYLDMCIMQTCD